MNLVINPHQQRHWQGIVHSTTESVRWLSGTAEAPDYRFSQDE